MWISRCERPLRSQELCHALGVELGAEDFSIQNVPSIRTVLGYTLGLAIVDEESSTLRLLHFTLQEYLGQHSTLFVTAHSMMAEICLTYLNCTSVRALPPDLDQALRTSPFLEYSTCFWGTHAARGVSEPVKSLALRLLDGYENHVSATVLWRRKMRGGLSWKDTQGITGLHCIAFWGIAEIASTMLERKGWQVNGRDSNSRTRLMWAVEYKNRGMVELFLEQKDIEPDTVIEYGRTVFSFAAGLWNEDAVKLLLERGDINPNSIDNNGRTPLSFAVAPVWDPSHGRFSSPHSLEVIVKLLLERGDVDPNFPDGNGRTPLSFAAVAGRKGVVELLLQRGDINPDLANSNGRTPLSFAVGRGWDHCLESPPGPGDINPYSAASNDRTPLSLAAENEWESVVKLLLQRADVDPDSADSSGRTPLSFAAAGRPSHFNYYSFPYPPAPEAEVIVKLLLERGDINPDSADIDGRTPLSLAAGVGEAVVVELLLQQGDVNPDSADSNGYTPLSHATESGGESVVKLLLQRGDVNPNSADSNGRTPLSISACRLHYNLLNPPFDPHAEFMVREAEFMVRILLERGDVDPNSPDGYGRTPLSFIAEAGLEGLVKLFLQRADINPDSPDGNGRTPLSFAAEAGHEGVLRLLLGHGDVNPDSSDNSGQKPLLYAIMKGHQRMVKFLSDSRTPNCESSGNHARMPASAIDGNASLREVTYTPTPTKLDTLNPVDGSLLDASASGPLLSRPPPLEHPLPLKQFLLDKSPSSPAPTPRYPYS